MELKLVKKPYQGVDTINRCSIHPEDNWTVNTYMYREVDGGLNLWFNEIERVNPKIVYLFSITSEQCKVMYGNNKEDSVNEIITTVRSQFKK